MTEMVMEQKEQAVAVSAFAKRNANKERIAREEEELQQLTSGTERKEESEGEPENAEERSFKKRYGDLRRYSQEQQTALQKQIDELKGQLKQTTEQQIKFPKTEEELDAWSRTYPDVAKIVETIAMKKAKEQAALLEERFRSLDEKEKMTAREKAEVELMTIHPDFAVIRDSDEFHNWVEEQPKWVQQALYENDTDSKAAARAIDLYKHDKGISKAKKTDNYKEAARSVGTRTAKSAPVNDAPAGTFYESQVARMSTREYEAKQEDIAKAIKSNKFVYDLSGSAR